MGFHKQVRHKETVFIKSGTETGRGTGGTLNFQFMEMNI